MTCKISGVVPDNYSKFARKHFMTIGEKIKQLRISRGMTQEDLAAKTDLSVRTIQRIENDEVDPRLYTLNLIANALEVDLEALNEKKEEMAQQKLDSENQKWFALIHLSGLFCCLIPPLLIWIWKKDTIPGINKHAIQVLNFQISMWIYLFSAAMLVFLIIGLPILIFLGLWSTIIIILNSLRVLNNQEVKYPFSLNLLKLK